MATAELAVALPALVLVLLVVLGAVGVGIDRVRCVDAARLGARAAARGEAAAVVVAAARAAAPPGAVVTSSGDSSQVAVTVAVRRRLPVLDWGVEVSATATAATERVVE